MLAIIKNNIVTNLVEGDETNAEQIQSFTSGIVTFISEDQSPIVSIGCSYVDGQFIPIEVEPEIIEITDEQVAEQVRSKRDFLLSQSDIKMLADNWNSMSDELKEKWSLYRQELRDIPLQEGFPHEVVWPIEP